MAFQNHTGQALALGAAVNITVLHTSQTNKCNETIICSYLFVGGRRQKCIKSVNLKPDSLNQKKIGSSITSLEGGQFLAVQNHTGQPLALGAAVNI